MSSAITTPPLNPNGGEPTKEFHCFPELPAELRVCVWQMAYDAIPNTLVYRFRLEFSSTPDYEMSDDEGEAEVPQAFFVPLDEVRHLTRELRSLRRVNREARYEGESLFDGSLRLNQTEQGGTTDLYPPINLPWKANQNFFCFVDLDEFVLECLDRASTVFIDQVFTTVRMLGLDMDSAIDFGIEAIDGYSSFAEFILLFTEVHYVALVGDRLMSEAELENIDDELRSTFTLSCWDDWVGRVQEDVIGYRFNDPRVVTKEQHLEVLEFFTDYMPLCFSRFQSESAGWLSELGYGMIFRTKEDLDYLLLDDFTLGELFGEEMLSDAFSDGMLSEEFSEWDESS